METAPLLWRDGSPFEGFRKFSEWLFQQDGRTHGIALTRLTELVFRYLVEVRGLSEEQVAPVLLRDYQRGGRSDRPSFLHSHDRQEPIRPSNATSLPRRQSRHRAAQ